MVTTKPYVSSADKLTDFPSRQQAGLPEVVPIRWLRLDPARTAMLKAIMDVDFTSATGITAGNMVSPWPLLCAPLAAVEAEHEATLMNYSNLRASLPQLRDMPTLYAETEAALAEAGQYLLKSTERLHRTTIRTQEAITLVADHLFEAGFVTKPRVEVTLDEPEMGA